MLKRALVAALALGCAGGLGYRLARIGLEAPLDPNEGWNAYHAAAAMSGGALYPQGMFVNNYPPLSFHVVGAVGRLTGDEIVAGRIVSSLSLAAVAACIFLCARRLGADALASAFGALWFVATMMLFTDYVGMDDPQLLGHALAMGGLLLLLRGNFAGAAAAMTLALFVKHNLVALPLASLAWLVLRDRRAAGRFAGFGIVFFALGLAVLKPEFLLHLNSPRLYSVALMGESVGRFLIWCGPGLIAVALLPRLHPVQLYALFAVAFGTFFSGGAGVDMNAWFDAAIAVSLAGALALDRRWVAAVYALPVVLGLVLFDDELPGAATADIAFLKAQRGPALCEMLSLCYWAGKKVEADVFNLGQAYAVHARDDAEMVRLLDAHRFAAIEFDSLDDFALGPRVKAALLRNYRVDHESDAGVFLVRR